jgi:hypothetical protein
MSRRDAITRLLMAQQPPVGDWKRQFHQQMYNQQPEPVRTGPLTRPDILSPQVPLPNAMPQNPVTTNMPNLGIPPAPAPVPVDEFGRPKLFAPRMLPSTEDQYSGNPFEL